MTTQLHNTGEEWLIDKAFNGGNGVSNVSIGLFNDGTDSLSDSSDVGSITTEPTGSAYAQQTLTLGSNFIAQSSGGNWEAIMDDVTFDTSDSNQSVDAYFVSVNFSSDEAGTTGDHLLFTGSLDQTYDLSSVDSFTLSNSGISIN